MNHTLYDACYDRLVFRHIAKYGYQTDPPREWKSSAIVDKVSREDALRIAYAVEQTTEIDDIIIAAKQWKPKQALRMIAHFGKWLPHLTAMQHPACFREEWLMLFLRWAYRVFLRKIPGAEVDMATAQPYKDSIEFCIISIILEHWADLPSKSGRRWMIDLAITRYFEDLSRVHGHVLFGQSGFRQTAKLFSCSAIIMKFASTLVNGAKQSFASLPMPTRIPWPQLMKIPTLFAESGDAFETSHIENMTSPEFLADGEWFGYYSYIETAFRNRDLDLDPPIKSLQLVTRSPAATVSHRTRAVIDAASVGEDNGGLFNMSGEVYADGTVSLKKEYQATRRLDSEMRGKVTPFGIVGVWGVEEQDEVYGYFWLWKEGWMREEALKEPVSS